MIRGHCQKDAIRKWNVTICSVEHFNGATIGFAIKKGILAKDDKVQQIDNSSQELLPSMKLF